MKELYMKMLEEEMYDNQLDNFMKEQEKTYRNQIVLMPNPCPNCSEKLLNFQKVNDITCEGCGHSFILVDVNTLRFK